MQNHTSASKITNSETRLVAIPTITTAFSLLALLALTAAFEAAHGLPSLPARLAGLSACGLIAAITTWLELKRHLAITDSRNVTD